MGRQVCLTMPCSSKLWYFVYLCHIIENVNEENFELKIYRFMGILY
jgi:hypothetical protein